MLRDMQQLKSKKGFRTNSKRPGLAVIFEAAQKELLSPDEKIVLVVELQLLEKRQALVFYIQICNRFKPDVDKNNWILLRFCTAADSESEQRIASVYRSLVKQYQFDKFWDAIVESRIVELFTKYRLANRILFIYNFKNFIAIVKKQYQSIQKLKRFMYMNIADLF